MSIDFDKKRWDPVRQNYRQWWNGELKRPLLHLTVGGRDPGRPEPALPIRWFTSSYEMSIAPAAIVDRWDYELSHQHYLGDAFPSIWPNFGAGVAAAFLGARLEPAPDTAWFHPRDDLPIPKIEFRYDVRNAWLARVRDMCRAAGERWEGLVQVGMTDIGGTLDILSAFRPGEKLLLDLYDYPDDVKRLTWDIHALWWRYYDELSQILRRTNRGCTAWTPIFSDTPYYMLQCDFAYMIGPEMFDEFVKPELAASCKRLDHAFYHLDGPSQLPHLDSLLQIPELKGIQWVPGAGRPDVTHWPEVYRKIRNAGKLIQIWGDVTTLDALAGQLGSAEGSILIGSANTIEDAQTALKKYGCLD